jgi:hypothetical protein
MTQTTLATSARGKVSRGKDAAGATDYSRFGLPLSLREALEADGSALACQLAELISFAPVAERDAFTRQSPGPPAGGSAEPA